MTATLTTVNGMLKEVYEGTVNEQLRNDDVLLKRIERSSEDIFETPGGKYVVFPLHTTRNSGISYRSENVQLGAAGRQGYQQAQETLRYGYGRMKITGQTMALANSNAKSFINAMDGEMDGLKRDLSVDSNRIAWGDTTGFAATGGTGVICNVTATATSTTVTVDSTANLQVQEIIDIVDNSGTPIAGGTGLTILSIPTATTFTIGTSPTVTLTVNHIVRTGNWNKEPYGVSILVDDVGTIHNVNSATAGNEYWRSIDDAATTVLTEAVMIKKADDIKTAGGSLITAVFCSMGVRRTYFNLMLSLRRYNEPKEWPGGLIGLSFQYERDLPLVADPAAPAKSMYFLTEGELKIYRDKDWYWEDTDGSVLKYVHDFDVFEGLMKQYWQIVTHKRNAHARCTNLTEA